MNFDITAESINLPTASVIFLRLTYLIFLVSFFSQIKKIKMFYLSTKKYLIVFILALLCPLLSYILAPMQSKIFYDEQIYMQIAQHIVEYDRAELCTHADFVGGTYKCHQSAYNKQPNGFPFFLSNFYYFFGISDKVGHIANYAAAFFTSLALWGGLYLLTNNFLIAIMSQIFFLSIPLNLIWISTVASEPIANLGIALTILSTGMFLNSPSIFATFMLSSSIAIAVQSRTEMMLLVPIIFYFIYMLVSIKLDRKKILSLVTLTGIMLLPTIVHLLIFRNDPWGSGSTKFSTKYFLANLKTNGPFYFNNRLFPILLTFFASIGVTLSQYREIRKFALALLLNFFFVYVFFYAGSYSYGEDSRYSLLTVIPIAVLSAIAFDGIVLEKYWGKRRTAVICGLLILTAISFVKFIPNIKESVDSSTLVRSDIKFINKVIKSIPKNSLVISMAPYPWIINGQSCKHASTKEELIKDVKLLTEKHSGGIYFHWGYWCASGDINIMSCDSIISGQKLEVFAEDESNQNYRLYKIQTN